MLPVTEQRGPMSPCSANFSAQFWLRAWNQHQLRAMKTLG
jgi:hypothetical protein